MLSLPSENEAEVTLSAPDLPSHPTLTALKVKDKFAERKKHLKLSSNANKLLLFNGLGTVTVFFYEKQQIENLRYTSEA